jgi:hypothetical protein
VRGKKITQRRRVAERALDLRDELLREEDETKKVGQTRMSVPP